MLVFVFVYLWRMGVKGCVKECFFSGVTGLVYICICVFAYTNTFVLSESEGGWVKKGGDKECFLLA